MSRHHRKKRAKPPGLSPGSLVFIGEQKTEQCRLTLIDYDSEHLGERAVGTPSVLLPLKESPTVSWVNIEGLHDTAVLDELGRDFDIHALVLEDILNTDHRPKLELYDKHVFVVLKMLTWNEDAQMIHTEQVALVLGAHYLLCFQEAPGDVFEPVRSRIRANKGRIRKMGPDYLMYALIDSIVDHYFVVLEKLGDRLEALEEEVFSSPSERTLHEIQKVKVELIHLRKSIWPLREALSGLLRGETALIHERIHAFLRDLYDHSIQVMDTLESYRDTSSGLLDIYLSSLSNRMNEVMKVLTMIATVFIPLTFIAGVYGMNFQFMPELSIPWAYPVVWCVMAVVTFSMLVYFKRKNWF